MRKCIPVQLLILSFIVNAFTAKAQEKWDLQRCVEFAWANNISVRQADVQARITELSYKQNLMSRYPNANFSNSTGTNFGRAVDPTTNLFASSTLLFQQYNLNVDALLYNWGRVRNTILSTKYSTEAAFADVERAKNDIGLTVATTYLQVLLSKEQARLAAQQMELTKLRLADTRKRVDAGSLPELNALELEAQYARDSSAYIGAVTTAEQNLLTLKATLNLDAAIPFDITEPPVATIPVENIGDLTPEIVYASALKTQPQQKVNDLRIKSLEANLKSAKAALYPSISAFGGLGTNFGSSNKKVTGFNFGGYDSASIFSPVTRVNNVLTPALNPKIDIIQGNKNFGEVWTGWGRQIDQNFRQNIGIQITVPIFNGGVARTNYQRVKYDIKNAQLLKEQAEQRLKNDIYQAYLAAANAMQRFNASKKTLDISERTFNLAQKRYDAGLLQTIELITNQNNLFRARIQMLSDQFDYVFRMKVLEFYKGLGLRL
jgi:outer membrane protein